MNLHRFGYRRHPSRGLIRVGTISTLATARSILDSDQEELKKRFGIVDLEQDILTMDLDELRRHFGYKNEKIKKGLFVRNVLWQIYGQIQAGNPPDLLAEGGNVRSVWYCLKPTVTRHRVSFGTSDLYSMVSGSLLDMVVSGLFSYRDFNMEDDRAQYRRLAPVYGNPHVVVIGEKIAFVSRFFRYANFFGVTTQMTRGLPSVIMADTMLTEMAEAGFDLGQQFVVLSFTDFDPVGFNVSQTFIEHLRMLGIRRVRRFKQYLRRSYWLDIVPPSSLPADFRQTNSYRIPASVQRTKLAEEWIQATGGVFGRKSKKLGISAEELLGVLPDRIGTQLAPFLAGDLDWIYRLRTFEQLQQALESYLLERIL